MPLPFKNTEALDKMVNHLSKRPHTVADLKLLLGVSERSVYRWLGYLGKDGFDIIARKGVGGTKHYAILA